MSSFLGKNINISFFGQSHSECIGAVVDNLPAGFTVDEEKLRSFMRRRKPISELGGTKRSEEDEVEIISGVFNGKLCGAPLTLIIKNKNANSADYPDKMTVPRPGHCDFTNHIKFGGHEDFRGGGHSSGRITAAFCAVGGIIKQILEQQNIYIGAHVESIGGISGGRFDEIKVSKSDFDLLQDEYISCVDKSAVNSIISKIKETGNDGNSLGGVVECAVLGVPCGIGSPLFRGVDNVISSYIFGIPAIKGIEFGNGFHSSKISGSENNDEYYFEDSGEVNTKTNNNGGISGGISTGMPIIFRVAVKPTPTISVEQKSIDLESKKEISIIINGRHDVCIVPRVVPCVEALTAIAVYDLLLDK